ncbi:MAG: hypothetical protein HN758_08620 [Verrucomicrobia bacterium]|nr:hypothetical protein [Verrucomicrobiota bacterium]MBT5061646.1 hypothetical protein [Verrucomicrobiota bacterium]MBT6806011.1 hypothetical protein [Verrucomicrobiota bacterium]MBT7534268.1 hypothetical protein [Verrucomicrobiota bacterium]MBT7874474.1 hypothetical protein [Verrucomicrobiota bacterium]
MHESYTSDGLVLALEICDSASVGFKGTIKSATQDTTRLSWNMPDRKIWCIAKPRIFPTIAQCTAMSQIMIE